MTVHGSGWTKLLDGYSLETAVARIAQLEAALKAADVSKCYCCTPECGLDGCNCKDLLTWQELREPERCSCGRIYSHLSYCARFNEDTTLTEPYEALRAVEFRSTEVRDGIIAYYCPIGECKRRRHEGHSDTCIVGIALRGEE